MSDNHRRSYVTLVAALRGEFSPIQLEALKIQLDGERYDLGSIGVLRQAVSDAGDVVYDAPALRTEYGWAPNGDASEVRVSLNPDPAVQEMWVRRCVREQGGSVFLRDATEWRQEP